VAFNRPRATFVPPVLHHATGVPPQIATFCHQARGTVPTTQDSFDGWPATVAEAEVRSQTLRSAGAAHAPDGSRLRPSRSAGRAVLRSRADRSSATVPVRGLAAPRCRPRCALRAPASEAKAWRRSYGRVRSSASVCTAGRKTRARQRSVATNGEARNEQNFRIRPDPKRA
jgi:hypothetical protein